MKQNASLYLPNHIKQELIDMARAQGFEVGEGRNSELAKFMSYMIHEYKTAVQEQTTVSPFCSLTPALRNTVLKLGKMDALYQQRVSQVLELICETWGARSTSNSSEEYSNVK